MRIKIKTSEPKFALCYFRTFKAITLSFKINFQRSQFLIEWPARIHINNIAFQLVRRFVPLKSLLMPFAVTSSSCTCVIFRHKRSLSDFKVAQCHSLPVLSLIHSMHDEAVMCWIVSMRSWVRTQVSINIK